MIYQASAEDFIYVVLAILGIVFSIYNSNKKKALKRTEKQKDKYSSPETSSSFLDNLIEEMGIKEESNSTYYNSDEEPIQDLSADPLDDTDNESVKIFSYDDYYEEGNFENEKAVLLKESGTNNLAKTKIIAHKNTKNTKRNKNTIDLRKAVIYSEILNKKYF